MHAVSSRKESSLPTLSMHDYVCIVLLVCVFAGAHAVYVSLG